MITERPTAHEVEFAHNSERQFALLLDFYGVPWQYEPRSFPIEWDESGEPTKFFTPDFYLEDDDLFIEITTMSQKLVTKKNRKVKLLTRLHPDVKCKVFYQRDYLNLVVKYGLEEPAQIEELLAPGRTPGEPEIVRLEERGERLTG